MEFYRNTDVDYSKLPPDDPFYDDFDITKVETGLSAKAKSNMTLLEDTLYVIDGIVEEGKRRGEELGRPGYYTEFYTDFYDYMVLQLLHGFEHQIYREHPVNFKFKKSDKKYHTLEFRYFVCNLAFWYPMIVIDPDALNDSFIITEKQGRKMTANFIADYMNEHYAIPYRDKINIRTLSETFADTNYLIMQIPVNFGEFIGTSVDVEEIRDMCKRMPEFEKGLYVKLDESLQPAEIEAQKKKFDDKQLGLIENDEVLTTFRIMVASNSAKRKQLSELLSIVGPKPGNNGVTLSKPINTNFLVTGMNTVVYYFINCIAGRNAAIINHEFMGSAGYLLILVALLCVDVKLSKTVDDCNTVNPIPIFIASEEHLEKLDGRWYRFNQMDEYKCINARKDKHLIGERIWLRSPATCAAPDGVCAKCYGQLYHSNKDLYSVGCYAAFNLMNPLVQGLLAAKHTNTTDSTKIEFNKEFTKYFTLSSTEVILNPELEDTISYSLVILIEDIEASDETDESDEIEKANKFGRGRKGRKKSYESDSDFDDDDMMDDQAIRLDYYVTKFYVVKNLHSKKKDAREVVELSDVNSAELYMHTDLLDKMVRMSDGLFDGKPYMYLDFDDISLDEFIFIIDVQNNEQTVPMKKMKALIHNQKHAGAKTLEDMAQMMLDLTIASGFDAVSVHGEIIIRQLIRKANQPMRRPEFSRVIMAGDYILMSVLVALKQYPAFSVSFSSSYLKYQLVELYLTYEKRDSSDLDWWYKRCLELDQNVLWYGESTDVIERSINNGGKL